MVPMNRFEAEELRLMSIRNRVSVKLGNQTTTLMKNHHKHRLVRILAYLLIIISERYPFSDSLWLRLALKYCS